MIPGIPDSAVKSYTKNSLDPILVPKNVHKNMFLRQYKFFKCAMCTAHEFALITKLAPWMTTGV